MQDLSGDGIEQTGWSVFYMHIESRDRMQPKTYVYAGDRIGHPSCEGGVSNGTHVHLARKYNGEWIPADGITPFELDGWISAWVWPAQVLVVALIQLLRPDVRRALFTSSSAA